MVFRDSHFGRHLDFLNNLELDKILIARNQFLDLKNPIFDIFHYTSGQKMTYLQELKFLGGHLGRHLEFLESQGDFGVAPRLI